MGNNTLNLHIGPLQHFVPTHILLQDQQSVILLTQRKLYQLQTHYTPLNFLTLLYDEIFSQKRIDFLILMKIDNVRIILLELTRFPARAASFFIESVIMIFLSLSAAKKK